MSSKSRKAHDTPEQSLQSRTDNFNKELQALLGKYNLQLGAQPVLLPDGRIAARPVVGEPQKEEKLKSVL